MKEVLVQVINLDRSPERLNAIGADLDQMGSSWSRLQAVEPDAGYVNTTKIYNRSRANYLFGRDLTRGEVGCFLSHLAALRALLSSECNVGLILEDDAQLERGSGQLINEISAVLSTKDPLWACVNLSYTTKIRRRNLASITGNDLFRAYQFPLLASALLWQKDHAKAFVKWCERVGLYGPLDNQLRDWIALGNHGISCKHPPVGLRAFPSTIADRPVTMFSGGYAQGKNKFTKFELRQKVPLYWRSGVSYLTRR
jgi:glycosyl transferase family 25